MCAHHDQHSPVAISHRIHGTGIFTYVWLIFMVNVRIRVLYIPYMDPLIVLLRFFLGHRNTAFLSFFLRGRPAAVHHVKRSNQLTTTVGFVDGEKKPSKYKNKSNSNEHLETESLMSLMLKQFNTVFVHHFCWSGGTSSNSCQCPRPHLPCRVLPLPPPRRNMTMEMNNNLAINFF